MMNVIRTLTRLRTWHFFLLAVFISEILTFFLNVLQSYIWWGEFDRDLIEIGTVDAFLVSIIVTAIVMPLIRYSSRSDEALKASEMQYRNLVENSMVGVFKSNLRGDILYVNDALARMAGFASPEDMMKYSVLAGYKSAHDRNLLLNSLREKGRVSNFEYEFLKKNGETILVLLSAVLEGEILSGMVMDITAFKKAEEALRQSTERLRTLIETTSDWIWEVDEKCVYTYVSQKVRDILGYEPEEVLGKTPFDFMPPEEAKRVGDFFATIVNSRKPFSALENINLSKNGNRVVLETSGVPFFDANGTVRGFRGVDRDVTERKRAEEQIRKLNRVLQERAAELERAYKDMETFSYAVSHDLQAPIRRIEGFSRILLKDHAGKMDGFGKDLLNRIEANGKMMGQLVDDLLSFSRVRTREIRKSEINMENLTRKVFEELKPSVGERTVQLNIETMPSAFGDMSMIRQVIMNLLSNALKFTRTRDIAVIEIGGRSGEDGDLFFVKDNGIGFDMQFSDKLFGLFQRVHLSKQFEGTGVGLVIVRTIIEKHGGRVWAEGKPDEGSTFYFTLPKDYTRAECPLI